MRRREKGSFTVEAALIMPVILGITVLFIYISMFCFDRVTVQYVSQMACLDAADEADPESYIKERIASDLSKRLVFDRNTQISVSSDETGITAVVSASSGIFGGIYEYTAALTKHFCPDY